ncbi:MAG: carboxypeptidase regulatory-like domain-containing protein [Clostridia bacterium]|nr:carboxypeptidase regulatory-like domain-containing protein [Clostridia bacterium]
MRYRAIRKILVSLLVFILMTTVFLPGNILFASDLGIDSDSVPNIQPELNFSYFSVTGNNAPFNGPTDSAVDSNGNLYISDFGNNRIVKFDKSGKFLTAYGTYGSEVGKFYKPSGIATDGQDRVYVADTYNNRVVRFKDDNANGTIEADEWQVWGGISGNGPLQFNKPMGVYVKGNVVYVADTYNHRISVFDNSDASATWKAFGMNGSAEGQFKAPYDVAIDNEDNIWVSDTFNNRVQSFDKDFSYLSSFSANYPYGLGVDSLGNVFAAERQSGYIKCVNNNFTFAGKGTTAGLFTSPVGVNIDKSDTIWVVDATAAKIQYAADTLIPVTGTATVITKLPDNTVLNGSSVTLTVVSTGATYQGTTNESGAVIFDNLPVNENFVITATNENYSGSIDGFINESELKADFVLIMTTPGAGNVTGNVKFDTGETAANVVVTLQFAESNAKSTTTTNENGDFSLLGLPTDGSCMVTAFDPVSAASGTEISYITPYVTHNSVQITIKKPIVIQEKLTNGDFSSGTLDGWEASSNVIIVPKEQVFPEEYPPVIDEDTPPEPQVDEKQEEVPDPAFFTSVIPQAESTSDEGTITRSEFAAEQNESFKAAESVQSFAAAEEPVQALAAATPGYSAIVTTAGNSVADGTLQQTFKVEKDAAKLVGRIKFVSNEWPTWYGSQFNDSYIVKLITPGGAKVLAKGNLNTSVWKAGVAGFNGSTDEIKVEVDVSAYEGKAVTLSVLVSDVGDMIVDSGVVVSDFKIIKQPTVAILVEQPVPGTRTVIDFNSARSVGHTFIRVDFGDGRIYYKGFWPKNALSQKEILLKTDVDGEVRDDNTSLWDIGKKYKITTEEAEKVYNFMINYNGDYNMVTNNCTTVAVQALQSIGIASPTSQHNWTLPPNTKSIVENGLPKLVPGKGTIADYLLKDLNGYTPADAGEDIRATGDFITPGSE